jgi:cytochrome c biogenesis protein CcmG, thiol:disulfide interchange protein DsbE
MTARGIAVLLLVLAPAGCGGGDEGAKGAAVPSPEQAQQRLAHSPAALAGLHQQANTLVPGGKDAFKRRLAVLRGHPVVLNKWASWCAPCRFEFPVLQRVSVKLGKRVAFLGLDSRDSRAGARHYLQGRPLSYPSYFDPREQIAATVRMPQGFPLTNFYDRTGALRYQHAGPYQRDAELERDIRKYADRG